MSTLVKAPQAVFKDERDDVVVLPAPSRSRPRRPRPHPSTGTFKQAVAWLMLVRELQRNGMTFAEANEVSVAPRRQKKREKT